MFANKALFALYGFTFVSALALSHVMVTLIGLQLFHMCKVFPKKKIPARHAVPVAIAYVVYVAGWNLTLNLNSIGFCQICKVMITPATACIDYLLHGKTLAAREILAIGILTSGVGLATVTDYDIRNSIAGPAVGGISIGFSAAYQVW